MTGSVRERQGAIHEDREVIARGGVVTSQLIDLDVCIDTPGLLV